MPADIEIELPMVSMRKRQGREIEDENAFSPRALYHFVSLHDYQPRAKKLSAKSYLACRAQPRTQLRDDIGLAGGHKTKTNGGESPCRADADLR